MLRQQQNLAKSDITTQPKIWGFVISLLAKDAELHGQVCLQITFLLPLKITVRSANTTNQITILSWPKLDFGKIFSCMPILFPLEMQYACFNLFFKFKSTVKQQQTSQSAFQLPQRSSSTSSPVS